MKEVIWDILIRKTRSWNTSTLDLNVCLENPLSTWLIELQHYCSVHSYIFNKSKQSRSSQWVQLIIIVYTHTCTLTHKTVEHLFSCWCGIFTVVVKFLSSCEMIEIQRVKVRSLGTSPQASLHLIYFFSVGLVIDYVFEYIKKFSSYS